MTPLFVRPDRFLQIVMLAPSHAHPVPSSHLSCQPLGHRHAPVHTRSAARQHGHMCHAFGYATQRTSQQCYVCLVGVFVGRIGEEGVRELRVEAVPVVQDISVGRFEFVAGEALQDEHGQAWFTISHAIAHERDSQFVRAARPV